MGLKADLFGSNYRSLLWRLLLLSVIAHNNNIIGCESHVDFVTALKERLAFRIDRVGFEGSLQPIEFRIRQRIPGMLKPLHSP